MNTNFLRGSRRYNNSPNGTTNNKSFREFKGKDEERGLYKVRLGHTVYAANHTLTRVSLYTTNFTEPLSYQDSAFLKLPKFP
ncbi:hypothetical protein ABTE81_19705, partial [Acinetobacter baumannii]